MSIIDNTMIRSFTDLNTNFCSLSILFSGLLLVLSWTSIC
uniref:Uncharacterized protein n=1 Tax=Rhizophora mucronata TaxID=61149 RepID=A0A2P2NXA9_RHIMU